jgi:dihydrofolate reductase
MATIYFTASSLDGYIVDEADSLDWLTSRAVEADGPFGYDEFIKSIGALVMGSVTYEWVVRNHPGEWMYEQPSWVLTHRPQIVVEGHPVQTFEGDVAELHPKLVSAAAGLSARPSALQSVGRTPLT